MKTILYIHGYNSNGNALKCRLLRSMFPSHRVLGPTLDYDHDDPDTVLEKLRVIIESEVVDMIVGSSFGGYFALCCTRFFNGPVWVINPVRDMMLTLDLLRPGILAGQSWEEAGSGQRRRRVLFRKSLLLILIDRMRLRRRIRQYDKRVEEYRIFDHEVFQCLHPHKECLNMALSLDDDLLGDHKPLLDRFPDHNKVVWMDQCGHHFSRFKELENDISETLQ